jgi:hypothetical protein
MDTSKQIRILPGSLKVFALAIILFFCSFQPSKNIFLWQEGKLLTWDDFLGKPEKRFAVASTHYDIFKNVTNQDKKAIVSIQAVFFRNSSWKKVSWISDEVLTHEQKHFDIVELYCRKLRQMVAQAKYKDYNDLVAKVDAFYDKIDDEMDKYQDLYDEETDGSMNGDKQREWNKKINHELEILKAYHAPDVQVNLP